MTTNLDQSADRWRDRLIAAGCWPRASAESTPPPVPAPEIPMRPATEDDLSAGARRLIIRARRAGWTTRATYARGPIVDSKGAWTGRVADSVALRLRGRTHGAVGMWHDGKWTWGAAWSIRADTGRREGIPAPIGYQNLCRLIDDHNADEGGGP